MKNTLWLMLLFVISSCSKHTDQNKQVTESASVEINNRIEEIANISGYINDNNVRIRNSPNTSSEILGQLNMGDYVTVIDTSSERVTVNNYDDYWYKVVTTDNIIGWIFGAYIELMDNEIPTEFAEIPWRSEYGNLAPIENISVNDLQSCSWSRYFTYLYFSKERNYAIGSHWDGNKYGKYILKNNTVYLLPPIEIIRFTEKYAVDKLFYSNELYFEGTPVLRNDDESVVFRASGAKVVKNGEIIRMNQHYCEKIYEYAKVNKNGYLFALPDKSSENMFYDSYYGKKATEVTAVKLAKTKIDNVIWYYTLFDFTSGEPTDGGGPFYDGWLSEEYFE
jgi:hypothetical protein